MTASIVIATVAFLGAGTMLLTLALALLALHRTQLLNYRFNHAIKVVDIEQERGTS